MLKRTLSILGVGIVTDSIATVTELSSAPEMSRAQTLDPSTLTAHDALTQLALRAAHQAWTMANLTGSDPEKTGLIMQTEWGAIDSTVAYLDSMLDSEGRYASPRHFSRSVYSSIAAAAAIHFGIKGPCETLTFSHFPVFGSLLQAWRLLSVRRCEQVLVIFGEQNGDFAENLAKMAAIRLKKRKFQRYLDTELGAGAVAFVVGLSSGFTNLELDPWIEPPASTVNRRPFAMDEAVDLLADVLSSVPRL